MFCSALRFIQYSMLRGISAQSLVNTRNFCFSIDDFWILSSKIVLYISLERFSLCSLSIFKIRGIASHFSHLNPIRRGPEKARDERFIHSFSRSFVRSFVPPSIPPSLPPSIHPSIHPFIQRVVKLWNLNVNGAGIGSAWRLKKKDWALLVLCIWLFIEKTLLNFEKSENIKRPN